MKLKHLGKKATAIVLSTVMAFSVNVATPTTVKAAEKTTITQRVGTIFDMKEATISGEIDLSFLEGYKLPKKLEVTGVEPGEEEKTKYYNPDYAYDILDMLYSLKRTVANNNKYESSEQLKEMYNQYLTKVGFLKKKTVKVSGVDMVTYEPNFKKVTAKIRFDGKLKDKYNGTYNLYLKLCNFKEVKLVELKVVNGKFIFNPMDLGKALGYYIDEKPSRVISSMFDVPVTISNFEIELFETLRNEAEDGYLNYKNLIEKYPDNTDYAESFARYAILMNMFKHIEKVAKTDDAGAIGRTFIDVAEKAFPILGVAVDNCYDKASVTKDGKTTLSLDQNSLFTLMDVFTLDFVKNSKTLKDKAKSITSLLFENESGSERSGKYLDEVNSLVDGYIDSTVKEYSYYAGLKEAERKEAIGGMIKGFLERYKGITFTDSLTGEKGGRDFEADGKVVIPFVGMDHFMSTSGEGDYVDPSEATAYQELTVGVKLSIKEPNAGKATTVEKKGPAVGKVVKDKKYSYRITKQGSTSKAGEVEIKGANKKNLKKITVASVVKIDGIKYKVTSIAKKAFKGNKKLTKVTIGKNVKRIKANAFAGCTNLKTVNCNSKVLSRIDKAAFSGDAALKTFKLKSTKLKKVAKGSFAKVKKTCKIKVSKKSKKKYTELFNKAKCKAVVK